MALPAGQAAVLDRHALAERLPEQRRRGRRQRDFRHQHQHAAARRAYGGGQANVDFGLAASGDAVHQRHPKLARIGHLEQPAERGGLLAGQPAW